MSIQAASSAAIDQHLVTLLRRASREVEDYKALRYAVEARAAATRLQVLAVTSPVVGDGKSTTAINLAGVLAHRRDARVLLVDTDLRRPSVGPMLGLASDRPGLADAILATESSLTDVVTKMPQCKLAVVTAGRLSDDPYELLDAPRTAALLEEARRQYDFVVLDTSPLLIVPDSRALQPRVDGFLLVVGAHRTPRALVAEALHLLDPSKVVGLVFNRDDRPLSRHYGGYYASQYLK